MAIDKYKMPPLQHFLNIKEMYDINEPVWVYLEREMKANIENKPYNEKVGSWLKFLKDLKYYYHREAKRKYRQLQACAGPIWYYELSSDQRKVLDGLKFNIHQDLIEDLPARTSKSLKDLGISAKISKKVLMKAMKECAEDPGVFMWNLYTALYKTPPSTIRPSYDMDSMLMMSCMVFIDLEECADTLEVLTKSKKPESLPPPKKKPKSEVPNVRYKEYLQDFKIPCYTGNCSKYHKKNIPTPIGYKFRLRSPESYERICKDHSFMTKRMERNKRTKPVERVCTYKFWEPPSTLRNTDPKMALLAEALKTLKKKAKPKFKSNFANTQYTIGGIAFCKGSPHFILNAVSILPTGYIPINGGVCMVRGKDFVTLFHGNWKYPKDVKDVCDDTCDCLTKWETVVMNYIKESKCKCGHLYDLHNEGKQLEKYFYPPTRHGPYWIDHAKIYQMDPTEDFIKDTVANALKSQDVTPEPSQPTISAAGLKPKELLGAFLADVAHTPLLIPHLPQANLLNNLQEWTRNRVQGELTEKQRKQHLLHSGRKWVDLSHINFTATAYRIPFTQDQLSNMNWSHRKLIQKLFKILLSDFVLRNRLKQLEQTRLWWGTTKYDMHPNKPFLDIFFTYMPGRLQDTFIINPYSSALISKYGAKTCPLT